jgi:heat shock protein HslJ
MIRGLLPVLAIAILLAACAPQPRGGSGGLAGTSWLLETLNGAAPLAGTTITLVFGPGDSLSGSDGCNQYNTSYSSDANSITVEQPIATTMMACAEDVMAQGASYLEALGEAASYALAGETLTLSSADGSELATFRAQSQDLAGTSWNVISYNNGQGAVTSVLAGTELTASFGADGNLTGSAGCNDYNATYTTSGNDSIEIGPAASTRMACTEPEGVMEQETQYLTALSAASSYNVDGDKLELRTSDGALAAQLTRAAE